MHPLIGTVAMAWAALIGNDRVRPGEPVPDLSALHWIQGQPVAGFDHGRVYVLEFWSTWCGACAASIDEVNEIARRYAADATFVAIHIWQREGAPRPAEFLEKRAAASQPVMEFAVAEDAGGATAAAWMDATQNAGLPTALIVDRAARLVWFGHTKDLETPLREVINGSFDMQRGLADMQRQIRINSLATESAAAIEKGEYEHGIKLVLEALVADPDTVAAWIPSTYGHLLARSGSPALAAGFARAVLARPEGKRGDLLAGMARGIVYFKPNELRDLDLALNLAERAVAATGGTDADMLSLLAIVRAERGNLQAAVRDLELAIQDVQDERAREVLTKTLTDLRARNAAPSETGPPSGP